VTFFSRDRVSPTDTLWDEPKPADGSKGPPPLWSALTHPVLAPPAGARPFYLAGNIAQQVVPFRDVLAPECEVVIQLGDVCVLKNLYIAFDTTFTPAQDRFWTLALDGVPIGQGFGAARTFGTGWTTANGLIFSPVDLRITTPGTLRLSVTDVTAPGPVRVFAGIMQGWLYPARFDAGLETT
jgi:hypothetical protein